MHIIPTEPKKDTNTASGKAWLLGAVAASLAAGAEANAALPEYFMWLLLSVYVFIPTLLIVPIVAIAKAKQPKPVHNRLWAFSVAIVGILSYGFVSWVINRFSLGAGEKWPVIFLSVLPSYFLWFAVRRWAKIAPNSRSSARSRNNNADV